MKQNNAYNAARSERIEGRTSIIACCFTLFIITLLLLLTACKKEINDVDDDLPVFGTCKPTASQGHLSFSNPSGPYTFKTSGGGTIVIDLTTGGLSSGIIITHESYPGFKLEFWGLASFKPSANHENLDGKHLKDRLSNRRTIIFPDGAKITFVSESESGPLVSVSIYDGAESHHINCGCGVLEHSSTSQSIVSKLDDAEADGETSAIEFVYSNTNPGTITGLLFVNIYDEQTPGNKVQNRVKLGEINIANPNQVNDYFDDPRLGHT